MYIIVDTQQFISNCLLPLNPWCYKTYFSYLVDGLLGCLILVAVGFFISDRTTRKKKTSVTSKPGIIMWFLVFIRIRWIEPVLIHTKKLCLASYFIQLSTNIKMYNHKIKTSFFSLRHLRVKKTSFNLIIVHSISAESRL